MDFKNHPTEVYELLEWFVENWSHENSLRMRKLIPERLRLWLAYCQREGLVSGGAILNITDFGRLTLQQRVKMPKHDGAETEYDEEDLPAKYRNRKSADGPPLIPTFLAKDGVDDWSLDANDIQYGVENEILTDRVRYKNRKPGPNPFAYSFEQLCVLKHIRDEIK